MNVRTLAASHELADCIWMWKYQDSAGGPAMVTVGIGALYESDNHVSWIAIKMLNKHSERAPL